MSFTVTGLAGSDVNETVTLLHITRYFTGIQQLAMTSNAMTQQSFVALTGSKPETTISGRTCTMTIGQWSSGIIIMICPMWTWATLSVTH